MERIVERKKCCGCEACKDICQKNAISMQRDEDGFFFPVIEESLCVNCGACGRVCPARHDVTFRKIDFCDTEAFGGYDTDRGALQKSASGGIAGVLAEAILSEGGKAYGVVFAKDDFGRVYYSSTDENTIDDMRGSKYVTAIKNGVYRKIKSDLSQGRKVLFVGLPCEVAALYAFLNRDYENLFTAELICAGASSYNLLDEQLKWCEAKSGSKISGFSFRFKKYGWVPYSIKATYLRGKPYAVMFDETIFGVGMKFAKREACFNCVYKNDRRLADLTVGDFWNVDRRASYYNESGTSVIFARTQKGLDWLLGLKSLYVVRVDPEAAVNGNRQQLQYPAGIPSAREEYLRVLREQGGEAAYRRFKPAKSLKMKIKTHLPAGLYKLLRRLEKR